MCAFSNIVTTLAVLSPCFSQDVQAIRLQRYGNSNQVYKDRDFIDAHGSSVTAYYENDKLTGIHYKDMLSGGRDAFFDLEEIKREALTSEDKKRTRVGDEPHHDYFVTANGHSYKVRIQVHPENVQVFNAHDRFLGQKSFPPSPPPGEWWTFDALKGADLTTYNNLMSKDTTRAKAAGAKVTKVVDGNKVSYYRWGQLVALEVNGDFFDLEEVERDADNDTDFYRQTHGHLQTRFYKIKLNGKKFTVCENNLEKEFQIREGHGDFKHLLTGSGNGDQGALLHSAKMTVPDGAAGTELTGNSLTKFEADMAIENEMEPVEWIPWAYLILAIIIVLAVIIAVAANCKCKKSD